MAAGPSEPTLSPLGYRHPPRYQKWLERARAAYDPPEPYRDGRIDPAPFVTWLCDSIGGLAHQVMAEADRLRISMSDKLPIGYADYGRDYCIKHSRDYDLWSEYEGEGITKGTTVMVAKEIYIFSLAGNHQKTYKTKVKMNSIPGENMSGTFYVCFDFQSAIADLTHEMNPWGGPFLTPGCKPTLEPEGRFSASPLPYGGPPVTYWDDPKPFDDESRVWAQLRQVAPRVLKDLVFGAGTADSGGARLKLAVPRADQVYKRRRGSTFKNGDPLNYRLVLLLPSSRHIRMSAIGRIQRWWRGVRMRLARQAMLEQILAEIYAPGGAAAALAAASFAAGASRQ